VCVLQWSQLELLGYGRWRKPATGLVYKSVNSSGSGPNCAGISIQSAQSWE
jgi:hypothetical protein